MRAVILPFELKCAQTAARTQNIWLYMPIHFQLIYPDDILANTIFNPKSIGKNMWSVILNRSTKTVYVFVQYEQLGSSSFEIVCCINSYLYQQYLKE